MFNEEIDPFDFPDTKLSSRLLRHRQTKGTGTDKPDLKR